jgi:hypothetical protein
MLFFKHCIDTYYSGAMVQASPDWRFIVEETEFSVDKATGRSSVCLLLFGKGIKVLKEHIYSEKTAGFHSSDFFEVFNCFLGLSVY